MLGKKSKIKSQNLSVMLTDIQGFTNTSGVSSREDIINLIRRHNKLMIPIIEFYNGKVIKSIGDALLCTFASATDAVLCSIVIQLMLKEYNTKQPDEGKRMNLRVVINSGDVSIEGEDIFGQAVNITARMEGLDCFPGGSIGISAATYLLMNKSEIVAKKIGERTLKGISEPITIYEVPLEIQKIDSIPPKLSQLVSKLVDTDNKYGYEASLKVLTEWSGSVSSYLQDINLGIGENFKKYGERMGTKTREIKSIVSQSVSKNIKSAEKMAPKTILETGNKQKYDEADIVLRIKSFVTDFIILTIFFIVMRITLLMSGVPGIIILLSEIISMVFYFSLSWYLKGATIGQIIFKNVVITENNEKPDFSLSMKRTLIFLPSIFLFGIGLLPIFIGDKKTLYDKFCETRVVK